MTSGGSNRRCCGVPQQRKKTSVGTTTPCPPPADRSLHPGSVTTYSQNPYSASVHASTSQLQQVPIRSLTSSSKPVSRVQYSAPYSTKTQQGQRKEIDVSYGGRTDTSTREGGYSDARYTGTPNATRGISLCFDSSRPTGVRRLVETPTMGVGSNNRDEGESSSMYGGISSASCRGVVAATREYTYVDMSGFPANCSHTRTHTSTSSLAQYTTGGVDGYFQNPYLDGYNNPDHSYSEAGAHNNFVIIMQK